MRQLKIIKNFVETSSIFLLDRNRVCGVSIITFKPTQKKEKTFFHWNSLHTRDVQY